MLLLITERRNIMKKILICILCLITLSGCQQQESSTSKKNEKQVEKIEEYENNAIVINNKTLKPKEQLTDIDQYLDNYDTLETESSAVFYSNDDIEIFVGQDKTIKKITLFTDKYQLDNHIKVGDSLKDIEKIYKNDENHTYLIDGINVTFTNKNNKISQIELEVNTY